MGRRLSGTLRQVKYVELVALGKINTVGALPREVYRMAVAQGCTRIIVAHNHPSTSLNPSDADVEFGKRMYEAGELLGIRMLDMLIVNADKYRSMYFRPGRSPFDSIAD